MRYGSFLAAALLVTLDSRCASNPPPEVAAGAPARAVQPQTRVSSTTRASATSPSVVIFHDISDLIISLPNEESPEAKKVRAKLVQDIVELVQETVDPAGDMGLKL